ncbi:DUF3352 domain-containing protein, partial [Candidatus Auribacterota bacterium]
IGLLGEELSLGIKTAGDIPTVTIISKIKDKKSLENNLALILKTGEKEGTIQKENYQNIEIVFVKSSVPEQPNIGFAFLSDNKLSLVIGGSIQDNKDIIDRGVGAKESFADNQEFKKLFKKSITGDGIFFINLSGINRLSSPEALNPFFAGGTDMVKAIGGVVSFAEGIELSLRIVPNKEKMSDDVLKLWMLRPNKANTLGYVPENTLFYTGTTAIDFKAFFESWKKNLAGQNNEAAKTFLTGLENLKNQNVDIENGIIPNLGKEFALVCSGLSADGIFPEIELSFMISTKNKDVIKTQLEGIIKSIEGSFGGGAAEEEAGNLFKIETATQQYSGVDIIELKLPLVGAGFSPCYAFIDDFTVISTSVKGVKKLIDVSEGKVKSIKEDANYKTIANIITDKSNQLGYVNVQEVLSAAVSICEWIISFQRLSMPKGDTPEEKARREEIEQTEAILKENVIPLLKVLKVVKVLGSNTRYLDDSSINQIFKLYIKDQDNTVAA